MGLRNDKRKASTGTPKIDNFYPGNWYTRHVGYTPREEKNGHPILSVEVIGGNPPEFTVAKLRVTICQESDEKKKL